MNTTTTTATQVYRVNVGEYNARTGRRMSGFTMKGVEATSRDGAAAIAVARSTVRSIEKAARHNADAERFGTWTIDPATTEFRAEKVRKFAADNR